MKKNMGSADRVIRLLVAAAIAALYFTNAIGGAIGLVLIIVAAVFVVTSLVGSCPLYSMLGINTCKTKKA
ncbi:MAG TPA: DUF2892 domain-containing protein [Puia sp.]|nr:DUF2892 domain-containing protein [Puia sp.]